MQPVTPAGDAIREQVRSFITESFLGQNSRISVGDDEDLLVILDSLQLLRMVIELESLYSIRIENSELSKENLGTVDNIANFVLRKTT